VLSSVVFVLTHPRLPRAYFAKGQNRSLSSPAPSAHAACPIAVSSEGMLPHHFPCTSLPRASRGKSFRMNTCKSGSKPSIPPRMRVLGERSSSKELVHISFRMNTCESVSKQRTLTAFRMNTYEKHRGEGVLWLTRHPTKDVCPERPSGAEGSPSFSNAACRGRACLPQASSKSDELSPMESHSYTKHPGGGGLRRR
jgi:hypothetical protein